MSTKTKKLSLRWIKSSLRGANTLKALILSIFLVKATTNYANVLENTDTNKVPAASQTTLYLKGGAPIQGKVLNVSSETVSFETGRGELLIPLKNLDDVSRIALEDRVVEEKREAAVVNNKEKSKLVSKILEEKELQAQESEGDSPRIRLGRKDYVYRKYTYRSSDIDYIFTPIGQNQVYDSEETLRVIFHKSIKDAGEAQRTALEITSTLGQGIQLLPPTGGNPRHTGIEFAGAIEGSGGNPSRVIIGRTFSYNNHYVSLIYTKFGREKTFDETNAWLGRNFERLQIVLRGVYNLPDESILRPPTEEKTKNDKETPENGSESKSQNEEN
jgi:hypothetical protein